MSTWVHHLKTGSIEEEINLQMKSGCCDEGGYYVHGLPTVPKSCPLLLLLCSDSLSCGSTVWFKKVHISLDPCNDPIDKQERG